LSLNDEITITVLTFQIHGFNLYYLSAGSRTKNRSYRLLIVALKHTIIRVNQDKIFKKLIS